MQKHTLSLVSHQTPTISNKLEAYCPYFPTLLRQTINHQQPLLPTHLTIPGQHQSFPTTPNCHYPSHCLLSAHFPRVQSTQSMAYCPNFPTPVLPASSILPYLHCLLLLHCQAIFINSPCSPLQPPPCVPYHLILLMPTVHFHFNSENYVAKKSEKLTAPLHIIRRPLFNCQIGQVCLVQFLS